MLGGTKFRPGYLRYARCKESRVHDPDGTGLGSEQAIFPMDVFRSFFFIRLIFSSESVIVLGFELRGLFCIPPLMYD